MVTAAVWGVRSAAQAVGTAYGAEAKDRSFLITGAGGGLGFETARVLALNGARVTVTARSQASAETAVAKLRAALGAAGASAQLRPLELDLSTCASTKKGAEAFLATGESLDVLICNAGVMAPPFTVTKDNIELQWQTNHVSHQLLTTLLLPLLHKSGTAQRPSRVVMLSSMGAWCAALPEGIAFDKLPPDAKTYDLWTRYGETKLANLLFAREVTRRCAAAGQHVIGVSLHPGIIQSSGLSRNFDAKTALAWIKVLWKRGEGRMTYGLGLARNNPGKTIPEGAATTVFCALAPALVPGGYYTNCTLSEKKYTPALADDPQLATKLFTHTEALIATSLAKT